MQDVELMRRQRNLVDEFLPFVDSFPSLFSSLGQRFMSTALAQVTEQSASELRRRIEVYLSQIGVSSVRLLDIQVQQGTVSLRGTVRSHYERQLCLSSQYVPGVRKVVDDLTVVETPPGPRS